MPDNSSVEMENQRMIILSDATFSLRRFELNGWGIYFDFGRGQRTVTQIENAVIQAFPMISKGEIRKTVDRFIDELEREWLIKNQDELSKHFE